MTCDSSIFNALLIDDKVEEYVIVQRILSVLTKTNGCVDHVFKCSEAVNLLTQHDYDLVLLDNRLSGQISAEFSAPFILTAFSTAKIAIISNDIDVPYLKSPDLLGVDYIIDKANLVDFLRRQVDRKLRLIASGQAA